MRNPMVKWCAVLVAACLLLAGCSGGGLPNKVPEKGMIVDMMRFKGMSRAEVEEMAGRPAYEGTVILVDPETGESAGREGPRGVFLTYEMENDIGYSFVIDTIDDVVVGVSFIGEKYQIPFDGESFAELTKRFGIELHKDAVIEKKVSPKKEVRWTITNGAEGIGEILIGVYDEKTHGFRSFEVVLEKEYFIE